MKIKQDFVTNSSTTCFIMIGYHVEETEELKKFINDYDGNCYVGGDEYGAESGKVILGVRLMDIDEYSIHELPVPDLSTYVEKVYKEFGERFNLSKDDIRLIGTVRMS